MRKKFLDNLQKRKEEKIPKMSTHPQRFCLRWNNHQSNLLTTFDQLFLDETFTDVTLAIDGRFIKAHKVQFLFLFLIFIIRNELSLVELFTICEHFFCSFFWKKLSYVLLITFLCFSKNVWLWYLLTECSKEKISLKLWIVIIYVPTVLVTTRQGTVITFPFLILFKTFNCVSIPPGITKGRISVLKTDKAEKNETWLKR